MLAVRRNLDLIAALLFTLLALLAAAGHWWAGVAVPLALAVAFFIPGYVVLAALYPGRNALDDVERLALSFGASWAVAAIVALVVNYLSSLETLPVMAALSLVILFISVLAWIRRTHLPSALEETGSSINPVEIGAPLILWAVVVVLSIVLLAYPVIFSLDTSAIQSLHVFPDLLLFSVLFLVWFGVFLFLLFGYRGTGEWGRLALVALFALVFVDFWVAVSPLGYHVDTLWHEGMVRVLKVTGSLPEIRTSYWNFPGVHLFVNFLSGLGDMSISAASNIVRFAQNILTALLLYLLFRRVLRNSYLAPLAVIIAVMGVPLADHLELLPHNFALVLLLSFLVVAAHKGDWVLSDVPDIILGLLLLWAVNISSFWHAMVLAGIIAAIYLIQFIRRERTSSLVFLIIAALITAAWQLLFAGNTYQELATLLPSWWQNITSGSFLNTATMSAGDWGAQVPLWAVLTRYFWLLLVVVIGSIIAVILLFRLRTLNVLERIMAGSVVTTAAFFVLVTVFSREGYYATRYQEFVRIFTPPLLISFAMAPTWPWQTERRYLHPNKQAVILGVALTLIFILALPTFLLGGRNISGDVMISEDIAAANFLESRFGEGKNLTVYSNQAFAGGIRYYAAPFSEGVGPEEPYLLKTESAIWPAMDRVVKEFMVPGTGPKAFVYSERAALGYNGWFGVRPDDSRWVALKAQLAGFVGPGNTWQNSRYVIYVHP